MTFRDEAARAVDRLFAKFGQTAQIVFADASTLETLVIHRFPDQAVDFLDGRVQTETDVFDVRLSVLPPRKIAQIVKGGVTYTVQGEPVRDQHGLVLKVNTYAS